ncbi:MAG: metalloregulator ArsR/SmtB family transcription factor [Candidatus Eisenbacteria bacterium]|nr:metalloregulator ArsR/SmtB family transcription factor [Candidatus Eisenbacteria bacterium]
MRSEEEATYRERAEIIKAMAHATRLYIVDVLSEGERCVNDLTELVGADMSTVSRHLSVLRSAGIVSAEKRGSHIYYHLQVPCVLRFFECVEAVLRGRRTDS